MKNVANWNQYLYLHKLLLPAVVFGILLNGCSSPSSSTNTLSNTNDGANLVNTKNDDLRVVKYLPAPNNTRHGADQLISENDVLKIDVFQVDDLDRTVRVDSNGRISMPLIGEMVVARKTIPAVEKEMETKYRSNYLQSPDISIYMEESAGQQVTMDGEFTRPGIYPTVSNSTLLQAIALAGGLSKTADDKKIFVFRKYGEQKLVANFSIKAIREGKSSDPRLFGGDVVVAFTSKSKVAAENLKNALGVAVSATRIISPF